MARYKCSYSFVTSGVVIVEADSEIEADELGMTAVELIKGDWDVDIEKIDEG